VCRQVHVRSLFFAHRSPLFVFSISWSFLRHGWRKNSSGNVWEKGTYLVNTFYHNLICGVGILDQSRIPYSCTYCSRFFVTLSLKACQELKYRSSTFHGVLGIATSLLVTLVLIDMLLAVALVGVPIVIQLMNPRPFKVGLMVRQVSQHHKV
jgi:hypothetical protein